MTDDLKKKKKKFSIKRDRTSRNKARLSLRQLGGRGRGGRRWWNVFLPVFFPVSQLEKSSNPKGIDRLIYNAPDLLLSISTFKFQSLFLGPHLGQDEVPRSHQKATRPASFKFSFLPTFTWTPSSLLSPPFLCLFPISHPLLLLLPLLLLG